MPNPSASSVHSVSRQLTEAYVALSKSESVWHATLIQALRHITQTCAGVMGVERASVWQTSPDLKTMECLCLYCEETNSFEQGMQLEANTFPRYFSALSLERVINATDAVNDPRTREFAEPYLIPLNIKSMLDGTLRGEGQIKGVICLEQVGQRRFWTEDEQIFVGSVADLVSQVLLFNSFRDRETRFRALFESSGDAVFVLRGASVIECNPAALRMFRAQREQLIGIKPSDISPETQPDGVNSAEKATDYIDRALAGENQFFEWTHRRFDNTLFAAEVSLTSVELDGNNCIMASVRDVSDRKQAEDALIQSQRQLAYRTSHDSLTELPNRDSLHQNAARLLAQARKQGGQLAIVLLDLNRFKDVNDTLGHRIGDFILQQVARRLSALEQQGNLEVYRLGGDEFALIQSEVSQLEAVIERVEEVIRVLSKPLEVEGMSLEMGASVGVALFPENGDNSHALLRCADVAMYQAKTHGERYQIYDTHMDANSTRRLTILADLGVAIRENQLQLHFQPRIDIATGACNGCEALLRWQHPEQGMVPPGDFIPLAEMTEIIHPLSLWVLRAALQQIRCWLDQGVEMAVAVNLSARNLIDTRCPGQIKALLAEFDVPNHLLEIEITESALITDPERALQVVQSFHDLGLHLAIDDFGTGYSSMSYLKRLPIQTLKVDRSFIKDMLTDEADAVIVRSTIGLAHSFGLNVVAEGVEDGETLQALRHLQCEQAQGYHISRPLPATEFDRWYQARGKTPPEPDFNI
ncbi:putative bifunctional diguanylate cyclase/phosphodiesterase [Ketobacter sp.]|uniref:putative bifunctional diguanylate cyclase/phosphodiesterase n=1 Tax=Ketobacter sp. TaxID=2083498 RepID=UPI000F2688EA|nr:EAL domain-containing protein [Ketobacter sp.]RLT99252.1 MAG: EAL domain-containing protein [Ketobacter sp.]